MITNQEIRLHCFELALKHFSNDRSVDELFEIAEKIYHYLYKVDIDLMVKDELTWDEYQKKLESTIKYAVPTSQNKKVKIRI